MTRQERVTLYQLAQALRAVPGVSNPMAARGHMMFHEDMCEVRRLVTTALTAMSDGDPDYREENTADLRQTLAELETFLARRKAEQWQ